MHIAMFLYSDMAIDLVWKDRDPVRDGNGLTIVPSATLADCPRYEIVFVPGGFGQAARMDDDEVLG